MYGLIAYLLLGSHFGRALRSFGTTLLLLLIVGYCWLIEAGTGGADSRTWAGRLLSMLYGVGAALTLDEFALWLNLQDVYWAREGRASIEAIFLFGIIQILTDLLFLDSVEHGSRYFKSERLRSNAKVCFQNLPHIHAARNT